MKESDLKTAVLTALKSAGYLAFGNAQDNRNRIRTGLGVGSADIIVCVKLLYHKGLSRFVGIELKLPGSKPKPHEARQKAWRDSVNSIGGYAVVVRTTQEAVQAVLNASLGLDAKDWIESK